MANIPPPPPGYVVQGGAGSPPPPPPGYVMQGASQPAQPAPAEDRTSDLTLSDLITGNHPAPSMGQQIGRSVVMAGRNVAHGVMSIPGIINDPIAYALNKGEDAVGIDPKYHFGTAAQATDAALNAARVPDPQPQSSTERVVGSIEQGMGGLLGGNVLGGALAGTGTGAGKAIGSALQGNMGQQLAATTASTGFSGAAREAGASPLAQLAIGIGGGLTPAGMEAAAKGSTSLAARALGTPSAQTSRLAGVAQDAGIPLKASQVSESKLAKLLDSATGQVPFSGAAKFQNTQQAAFNKAVSRTIGESAYAITPQVFAAAKARIGASYDDLATRVQTKITPAVQSKLDGVYAEAQKVADDGAIRAVGHALDRVKTQSVNGELPGDAYKSIDSLLGKLAKNGGEKGNYASEVRSILRKAFSDSAGPEDQAQMAQANSQYRDLKTIEPLVAEASATGGNISPGKLLQRVTADKAGKAAVASGRRGSLAELAQVGKRFIKDPIPDSGTARRTAVFDALKGTGGVIGSAIGTGAAFNPLAGLLTAGSAIGLSRKFQSSMQNPKLLAALLDQPDLSPSLRRAIEASINPTTQGALQAR